MVQTPLWENRDDKMTAWTDYAARLKTALQPEDITEVMIRMIEDPNFGGGTCVLRTQAEEKVVEEGFNQQAGKCDPSPRPEPDLTRLRELLSKGKAWG
jgi:hypothetical protein